MEGRNSARFPYSSSFRMPTFAGRKVLVAGSDARKIRTNFLTFVRMKILMTGCAGFIGFHLTKRLLHAGHEIVGIDNLNDYYDTALKQARLNALTETDGRMEDAASETPIEGGFRFVRLDVCDREKLEALFAAERFDAVCHLAAQAGVRYSIDHPEQYVSTNLVGFFHLLECCRRYPVKHLVFASSSSVYGKNARVPYREDDKTDAPVSLYAATKKSTELMAHSYAELYGIRATGLRFFTVYGPWGRPDMAPFLFTRAILEGTPIRVFNGGDLARDFTYIDDIAEGTARVLTAEPAGGMAAAPLFRIYNIGNSEPVRLEEFIAAIERIAGRKAERISLPMQPGDVRITWADVTRLRNDYGYAPCTPLETGLARFVDWYRNFYATPAAGPSN